MSAQYPSRRFLWNRKVSYPGQDAAGFRCVQCDQQVPTSWLVSGVHNRNHCPYCLYSRHLDLFRAGDRLAACKGSMQPVGLTFKRVRKKYSERWGELMLVHRCMECGKFSINRIAADDDSDAMLALLAPPSPGELEATGIHMLTAADLGRVEAQLFGRN